MKCVKTHLYWTYRVIGRMLSVKHLTLCCHWLQYAQCRNRVFVTFKRDDSCHRVHKVCLARTINTHTANFVTYFNKQWKSRGRSVSLMMSVAPTFSPWLQNISKKWLWRFENFKLRAKVVMWHSNIHTSLAISVKDSYLQISNSLFQCQDST